MTHRLLPYSKKAEGPLQIFQGSLELNIQLVVHTQFAYKKHALKLPNGLIVLMAELGYESRLCNMAVVSAAAAWEGFVGNVIRAVRQGGKRFRKEDIYSRLKKMKSYKDIIEPLARRHCIVHNLARIDSDYKKAVQRSQGAIGDSLQTELSYLKEVSRYFFEVAADLMKYLVRDGYLEEKYKKPIGEFDGNPIIG